MFRSLNAGLTWIRVAGNLEKNTSGSGDAPSIRWLSVIPFQGHLKYFAGTSIGLFSADSLTLHDLSHAGTVWTQEGVNEIGQTIVPYIYTRDADNFIAVATHGSGVFTTHYGWNVGVDKIATVAEAIQVSPNPASDQLTIAATFTKNTTVAIQLYNLQGQLVFAKNKETVSVGKWTNTLPVYQLAAGTYLMQVQAAEQTWNKKIVITH
jgi:hypothetical protein